MRTVQWLAGALSLVVLASVVDAQRARSDDARRRAETVLSMVRGQMGGNPDDAVLGVTTASSGERDTLGLLVTSVTPDGPADKAGIEEGHRLAAINGVNLKLAGEDAGEADMHGMTTRRLVREMGKVKAGDAVELSVWRQGRYETVRVHTVAREDLPGQLRRSEQDADERAVVGVTLQTTGSIRDTLGPMVVQVAADGPAERAGIVEGDRIQSVNGTSLRVSRDDTEEPMIGSARVNRFSRILRDLKVGDAVELQVYSGGQTRTVRVTTMKAGDVYEEGRGSMFFFRSGEGWPAVAPLPPVPPVPPMPYSGTISITSPRAKMPARVSVIRSGGVI